MKPRCPWRVDGLVPYRLLVALIENRRVNGKVRQEHVADLGSIEGHLLSGFYAGHDPTSEQWRVASVQARHEFWQGVLHDTLPRLANRVNAEAVDKIIASIAARISMPTADDYNALDLYQWKYAASTWQRVNHQTKEMIADNERMRDEIDRQLVDLRKDADREAANMVKAQTEVLNRLSRR